ncbi:MAG TPA: hypothetical protein VF912_13785 [Anaeromyxobacter sp.]
MGAWRGIGTAVVLAVLLRATVAAAGTLVEPIARLFLEGGWDSNALYDGQSADTIGRFSPEVGLRLHAPLWDLKTTYGGELVYFERLASGGIWNHRAGVSLDSRPTRLTIFTGNLRLSQAFDPAGLAQAGVFRTGRQRALVVNGRARFDFLADPLVDTAATMNERSVLFQDGTGGAMHAPGVETLWRFGRRLALGAAYGFGLFQSFEHAPTPDALAYSHAVRLRARWRAERHVTVDASAGPALWLPAGSRSIVPEALVEVLIATRGLDLRFDAAHGLGIGATARPGLVDYAEIGAERRWARRWFARGDGGLWRSGTVPSGRDAVTGYMLAGEAGAILGGNLRLSITGAQYGRTDDLAAAEFRRTTVGLRVGWELPGR